jgi:hypothetical protein
MINFFQEGSNIGFSINGWFGVFLLLYILIEFSFFIITKTLLIHKIIIGIRVRNQIKKMLPDWWYIQELSYFTINKMKGEYEVYVRLRSKIPTGGHHIYGDNTCTTNDWVEVNWLGTIKRQSLMASIFSADIDHQSHIKQWSREKALEKIGI